MILWRQVDATYNNIQAIPFSALSVANLLVKTVLILTFAVTLFILYVPASLQKVMKYCYQLSMNVAGSALIVGGMTATQLIS